MTEKLLAERVTHYFQEQNPVRCCSSLVMLLPGQWLWQGTRARAWFAKKRK